MNGGKDHPVAWRTGRNARSGGLVHGEMTMKKESRDYARCTYSSKDISGPRIIER